MNQLERIQRSLTKKSAPHFEIGDTVKVTSKSSKAKKSVSRSMKEL